MMNEEQLASYTPQPPVKSGGGSFRTVFIALVILVLVGALGFAGYVMWNKTQTLQSYVSTRDAKIEELNKKVASLSSQNTTGSSTPSGDSTVLAIRELGISLAMPESLKDVSYSYGGKYSPAVDSTQEGTITSFSTQTLTDTDEACSSFGVAPPLGGLVKVMGQYPQGDADGDTAPGTLVKQFSDFYIAYINPQGQCSATLDSANTASLMADFKATFSTIKELQQ